MTVNWDHRNFLLVAEAKWVSPFGLKLELSPEKALEKAIAFGDIVSIHTNPLWGGSLEWLAYARSQTEKPILAKGFHNTLLEVDQAFAAGATYVLTVGWWPRDPRCWHECESLEELRNTRAPKAVWNARNPRTGEKRPETSQQARSARTGWLCQASQIRAPQDVHPGMQAALVGEGLFQNP